MFGVEFSQTGKPLGQAELNKTRKDRIMDAIIMGLICGGLVLIVPLFALIKANRAAKEVDDLKQKVQRLEGRLNDWRRGQRVLGSGSLLILFGQGRLGQGRLLGFSWPLRLAKRLGGGELIAHFVQPTLESLNLLLEIAQLLRCSRGFGQG